MANTVSMWGKSHPTYSSTCGISDILPQPIVTNILHQMWLPSLLLIDQLLGSQQGR